MDKPVIVVGYKGRMAQMVMSALKEKNLSFRSYSENAPNNIRALDFMNSSGVIDFSLPEATPQILEKVKKARVPWVCGTTGWKTEKERRDALTPAAELVPVVLDSNFSLGIELLCQMSELVAKQVKEAIQIIDIHHIHKRDQPSGTALKLRERILSAGGQEPAIESIRKGEVPGTHLLKVKWGDDALEFKHEASSRKIFAEGAVRALQWTQNKKPELYSMKDVFQ